MMEVRDPEEILQVDLFV